MKPMTDRQVMESAYSLAEDIREVVKQALFIEHEATNDTVRVVMLALSRVLGEVIGSVSNDEKMIKSILGSLQSPITRFADDMRRDMATAREMRE